MDPNQTPQTPTATATPEPAAAPAPAAPTAAAATPPPVAPGKPMPAKKSHAKLLGLLVAILVIAFVAYLLKNR